MKHARQKETYDRGAVGARLQSLRKQKDWSRRYVADRIGVVERYYADIERGSCGMSIETLIALTDLHGITMDFLIYGRCEAVEFLIQDKTLQKGLANMSGRQQETCRQMLTLLVQGIGVGSWEEEKKADSAGEPVEGIVG